MVGPDAFEVVGSGSVLVYDARAATVSPPQARARHGATGLALHVLKAGMRFRWRPRPR